MTMSAVVLAVLGVLTLFFPEELVTALQLGAAVQLPVQLLAGGFFGIAVLDWTGRGAIYGGIYGRPIVLANFGSRIPTARPLVSSSTLGRARGGPSKRQPSPSPTERPHDRTNGNVARPERRPGRRSSVTGRACSPPMGCTSSRSLERCR